MQHAVWGSLLTSSQQFEHRSAPAASEQQRFPWLIARGFALSPAAASVHGSAV